MKCVLFENSQRALDFNMNTIFDDEF